MSRREQERDVRPESEEASLSPANVKSVGMGEDFERPQTHPAALGDLSPYSRKTSAEDYAKVRRRKKRRKIVLCVVLSVLIVMVIGVGSAFAYLYTYVGNIETQMHAGVTPEVTDVLQPPEKEEIEVEAEGEVFYMLLMGTDKSKERDAADEYGGSYRSDSMILTRVDTINKKVTMVSLHRDTEIQIEGYGLQKLNASYAYGGPAGAIRAVSELAGVPISHYVEINFDGFRDAVDALGGVEVDVPMEINDRMAGGHVDAGFHTITGDEALILCRARHAYDAYGDGDRYRAANQRLVLGAIAKKILQSDAGAISSTIEALSKYVTTDFTVIELLELASSFQGMDPSRDIYSAMEPTTSEYKHDTWYEQLNTKEWNAMMSRVRQGLPPTEEAEIDDANGTVLASVGDGEEGSSDVEGMQSADMLDGPGKNAGKTFSGTRTGKVTIKNGNGVSGCGAEALERIESLGYSAEASNANSFNYRETVVVFGASDQRPYAEELVKLLGCGRAVQNVDDKYAYEGDFLILIGADWE